jgi:hypothetical protein
LLGPLNHLRRLLDAGCAEIALQNIPASGCETRELKNARTVCLLRQGRVEAPVKLLRRLVLPNDTLSIDEGIPDGLQHTLDRFSDTKGPLQG